MTSPTHDLQWLEEPLRALRIATTYDLIANLPNSIQQMRDKRAGMAANIQQRKESENESNNN